jgi:hypothetical protein
MMESIPSDSKSSTAEEVVDGDAEEESGADEVAVEETEFNGVLISGGDTNIGPTDPANIGTSSSDVAQIPAQGAVPVTVHPAPVADDAAPMISAQPSQDVEAAELQELPPQQQHQHPDLSANADADEEKEEGERSTAKTLTWRAPLSSLSNSLRRRFKGATPGRRELVHRPSREPTVFKPGSTFGNFDSSSSDSSNNNSSSNNSSSNNNNNNSNSSNGSDYLSLVPTSAVLNGHFLHDPVNSKFVIHGHWAYNDALYMDRHETEPYRAESSVCRQREKTIRFDGDFLNNGKKSKDSFTMLLSRPFENSGEGTILVSGSGSWWYHTSALSKTEFHFVFNGLIDLDNGKIIIHRFPSTSKVNVDGSSTRKRAASRSASRVASRAKSATLNAVSKVATPFRSCVQGRKKSRRDVLPQAQRLSPHPHISRPGFVVYLHGTYNEEDRTFTGLWSSDFSDDPDTVGGDGHHFDYAVSLDTEKEMYTLTGCYHAVDDRTQVEDEFSFKLIKNDQGTYNIFDDQCNDGRCSIYGLMWGMDNQAGEYGVVLERVYFSPEVGEEDAVVDTGEEEKVEEKGPEESDIEYVEDDDKDDDDSSGSYTSTDDEGSGSDEIETGDEVEVNRNDTDSSSCPLSIVELLVKNSVGWEQIEAIGKRKIQKYGLDSGMTGELLPPDTFAKEMKDIWVVFIWSFPTKNLSRMLELSKTGILALENPSLDQLFQNLMRQLVDEHNYTPGEAATLVYDHTLWIDAFPNVAEYDWRKRDSFKEFAVEATDISFEMIVGLLGKLPKLKAIYAVGAEGFKMLNLLRKTTFAEYITQQEGTHHGSQLAKGWCTGPEIANYLVQVVFPACDILAGCQALNLEDVDRLSYNMFRLQQFATVCRRKKKKNEGECSVQGCGKKAISRGMCGTHYKKDLVKDKKECSVQGCEKKAICKGMCSTHYQQNLAKEKGECSVQGCEKNAICKGMCSTHYQKDLEKRTDKGECSVQGCEKKAIKKGMCGAHYQKDIRKK